MSKYTVRRRIRTNRRRRTCNSSSSSSSSRARRGGTRNTANSIRRYIVHKILPLLAEYKYYTGAHIPHASSGTLVKHGERHYRTFVDIPPDDGAKESFRELRKDFADPVKNLDKLKTAHDKLKELVDEEKRKYNEQNGPQTPRRPASSLSFNSRLQLLSPYLSPSTISRITQFDQPQSEYPTTPNAGVTPDYSTPQKVPSKRALRRPSRNSHTDADVDVDADAGADADTYTPVKTLFNDDNVTPATTPIRSPPRLPDSTNLGNIMNDDPRISEVLIPVRHLKF
jgi:hypothetical protein